MARLLLVQTPFFFPEAPRGGRVDTWYSLGLAYLDAVARQHGHEVHALNGFGLFEQQFTDALHRTIRDFRPTVIGFQLMTSMREPAFRALRWLRQEYPRIQAIVGGPHATALPQQLLRHYPEIIVVQGEAETMLPNLLKALDEASALHGIPGVAFVENGRIQVNPRPAPVEDLDALPFPNHDAWIAEDAQGVSLTTSRGCPFACTFCAVARRKMRYRSITNVVDEVEGVLSRNPHLTHVRIWDDQFFFKPARVIEFCNEIVRRNVRIGFTCLGRLRPCTREMVLAMEAAGFREVLFGLETGSPKVAELCDKHIKPDDALDTLTLFADSRIDVYTYLIVGLMGETRETLEETIQFTRRLQKLKYAPYGSMTGIATVYPDNELYQMCKAQGTIDDDFWINNAHEPYFTLEHDEATLAQMHAHLTSYIEPAAMLTSLDAVERQKELLPEIISFFAHNWLRPETPKSNRPYLQPFVDLLKTALTRLDAERELNVELPAAAQETLNAGQRLFPYLVRKPGSEHAYQPAPAPAYGNDPLIEFVDYVCQTRQQPMLEKIAAAFYRELQELHASFKALQDLVALDYEAFVREAPIWCKHGRPEVVDRLRVEMMSLQGEDQANTALRLGWICFSLGRHTDAEALLGMAIAHPNTATMATLLTADLYLQTRRYASAALMLRRTYEKEPYAPLRMAVIAALWLDGRRDEAMQEVAAIQDHPDLGARKQFMRAALGADDSGSRQLVFAGAVEVLPSESAQPGGCWQVFQPGAGQSDVYDLLSPERAWTLLPLNGATPHFSQARAGQLVVNLLADPDICRDQLIGLQHYLDQTGLPCINAPAAVAQSSRDVVAAKLAGANSSLQVPLTVKWEKTTNGHRGMPSQFARDAGLKLPLIARPAGSHTGNNVFLANTYADLDAHLRARPESAWYLTQYVDYVSSDGLYRKTRAFLIGGECILAHHLTAPTWNVHMLVAHAYMSQYPEAMEEEAVILRDQDAWLGGRGTAAFQVIRDCLKLDYLMVDFSRLADGSLLLFEANPVCRFVPLPGAGRPALAEPMRKARSAFAELLQKGPA